MLLGLVVACGTEPDDRRGESCTGPQGCDGFVCAAAAEQPEADLAPLALACGAPRQGAEPGTPCERGGDCTAGICLLAGACAEPCAGDGDCGRLERCQAVYARGASDRLHPLRACVAMVDLPGNADVQVETRPAAFSGALDTVELGPAEPGTLFVLEHLDDESWPIPFPASSCRPPLCAAWFEPAEAGAARWFDRSELMDPDGPINPIAIGDHVYPLTIRIAAPSASGFRLGAESKMAGRARVTQLRRAAGSGRLDLNLFLVGPRIDADLVDEAVGEVDRIFEPAGIFTGELRYVRIAGELVERGADLPDAEASRGFERLRLQYQVYPQLPELLKLSAGAANTALNVFFVESIDAGARSLAGLAGSTPVPFGMHGTGASGVVVATGVAAADAVQLGRNLAHELGHALGLFHPVETDGSVLDSLPDTPACDPSRDRDGNGLEARECAGAGGDNLMFPTTNASASDLTPDQIGVLRSAFVLQ